MEVRELVAPERPTAVIADVTTWEAFPELWRRLLDEVWRTLREMSDVSPGRNVMLYLDERPSVEIGAEVAAPFAGAGRVVGSSLPAGRVLTATHRGSYALIGDGHRAVIEECRRRGLEPVGPRWEVYGHAVEREADQEVEITYLVR
jgi:effector-binding domain-containing protein